MSYILDAIKKSEQERKRGTVPDLQSIQVAVRPFRRSSVVKMVILSVWAIATLVLVALWLEQKYSLDKSIVDNSASRRSISDTTGNDVGASINQSALPTTTNTNTPPAFIAQQRPSDIIEQVDHHDVALADSPKHDSKKENQAAWVEQELITPSAQDNPPLRDEIIRPRQKKPATSTKQIDSTSPIMDGPEESIASVSEDFQNLPELNHMQPAFSASLPRLEFVSHLYSNDPVSRSVIINGKSWHEGDTISPGLLLIAITQEGVVLSYRGDKFRMPVVQNWSGH